MSHPFCYKHVSFHLSEKQSWTCEINPLRIGGVNDGHTRGVYYPQCFAVFCSFGRNTDKLNQTIYKRSVNEQTNIHIVTVVLCQNPSPLSHCAPHYSIIATVKVRKRNFWKTKTWYRPNYQYANVSPSAENITWRKQHSSDSVQGQLPSIYILHLSLTHFPSVLQVASTFQNWYKKKF